MNKPSHRTTVGALALEKRNVISLLQYYNLQLGALILKLELSSVWRKEV